MMTVSLDLKMSGWYVRDRPLEDLRGPKSCALRQQRVPPRTGSRFQPSAMFGPTPLGRPPGGNQTFSSIDESMQ
jgi:hypothetical protein